MAREKKPTEGPLSYPVKFREEFGKKLAEVAEDLGEYPGDLVEKKIGAWVRGEYLRVLKAKLKRAEEEGRPG